MRLQRALLVAVVCVLPCLYLVRQAWFDPRIEFLTPALGAEWAVHPAQKLLGSEHGRVSDDVEFGRDFAVDALPARLELRLRAFTVARVTLNDREVLVLGDPASWKTTARVDVTPHLRVGPNRLRIRVHNDAAVPALLVDGPSFLRTPGRWSVALATEPGTVQRAVGAGWRPPKPGPLQAWSGWWWAKPLVVVWLAAVAALGLAVALRQWRGGGAIADAVSSRPLWARVVVPALLLLVSLELNVANTSAYPPGRSKFDWVGHAEYIRTVALTWRAPTATEGWMMYQPPLYYFAAAAVYQFFGGETSPMSAMKAVQLFDCLIGFALTVLTWLFVRWAFPEHADAQWVGLAFGAFLPMTLYMSPIVTNELAAGAAIAAVVYLLVRLPFAERMPLRNAVVLGVAVGLALLVKFSALHTLVVGAMVLGFGALQDAPRGEPSPPGGRGAARTAARGRRVERRTPKPRAGWSRLVVFLAIVLAVCGWYYARNVQRFGHPFVGNWDVETGFHFEQRPGYRTAGFYLGFGDALFQHPERSRWTSWPGGNYASMWADTHGTFFDESDGRAYFWQSVMLVLGALPTLAILLGLARTGVAAARRPWSPDTVLFAVPTLTWLSLVAFTLEVPFYSTVKAPFFLYLVPGLAVCLLHGRQLFDRHLRPARWLLDGVVAVLAVLAVWIYRFSPPP